MEKYTVMHFIESEGVYGAETVLLNLSQQMKNSASYEPIVGCIVKNANEQSDLYDRARELGIEAKKMVIRNGVLYRDLVSVSAKLKEWNIGLIHSHGYKPSIYGYVIKRLTGISLTATCHLWFRGKRPMKFHVMTAVETFLYRFFPVVVAVSEPIKSQLVKKGIAQERIQVINNGIFLEKYRDVNGRKRAQTRKSMGITDKQFVTITVGRLNDQKNQRVLIEAAKELCRTGNNYRFFIVGEGSLRTELEKLIKAHDLSDTVSLLGFRKEIGELLHASDAFILTSRDEGLPMSFLEAVSSRTPIISTPVGNIPKIISHGKTGYVIRGEDPSHAAETIAYVRKNPREARKLTQAAYHIVREKYSTQAMYEQYDRIYKSILDTSSHTRSVRKKKGAYEWYRMKQC